MPEYSFEMSIKTRKDMHAKIGGNVLIALAYTVPRQTLILVPPLPISGQRIQYPLKSCMHGQNVEQVYAKPIVLRLCH